MPEMYSVTSVLNAWVSSGYNTTSSDGLVNHWPGSLCHVLGQKLKLSQCLSLLGGRGGGGGLVVVVGRGGGMRYSSIP